jgi:hypothetical protein
MINMAKLRKRLYLYDETLKVPCPQLIEILFFSNEERRRTSNSTRILKARNKIKLILLSISFWITRWFKMTEQRHFWRKTLTSQGKD